MMRLSMMASAMLFSAALPLAPVHAEATAAPATETAKKVDLNEIVCEKQKIPGSRLASAKVCHSRAEWAALRQQDRTDLERAQTQRGTDGK